MNEWVRIPAEIKDEADRRVICGILAEAGLDCRVVKVKMTNKGAAKRFVEYRDTGAGDVQINYTE